MTEPFPSSSPHRHAGTSVQGIMLRVAAALVPGLAAYVFFFGIAILVQCLLAVACAVAVEAAMLALRGRPMRTFLADGSAVVTGLLFALSASPFVPWWLTLAGTAFAVAVAKHAFGGLGCNPFNPAMAGYVFVLLCFPAAMNAWPAAPDPGSAAPGLVDAVHIIFGAASVDAFSGATALNRMQTGLASMNMISEIRVDPVFSSLAGRGWEWVAAGWLLGGAALLAMGIISWQIPAGMLGAMIALATGFHLYDPELYPGPIFHLFAGGTLLGAFFIATDPVTAATTPRGRLVYGALTGFLVFAIRTFGAFPDGVAFAVLLGNAAAPVIDHFTRPRVLGEGMHGR
jgi:electron transport complex protein RnfD